MRFEAEIRGSRVRKFDAHGNLYISTLRMVFVPNSNNSTGGGGWLSFLNNGLQTEAFQAMSFCEYLLLHLRLLCDYFIRLKTELTLILPEL